MNKLVAFGVRQLFGGARRGQSGLAGLGAALAIYGWLRDRQQPKELIYRRKLREGEEVRVKFARGDTDGELTVKG